jgi:xylulokinase
MLLLGIDLGTSFVKVSVVDAENQQCLATASCPSNELEIIAHKTGWAEQNPDLWWQNIQQAILKCNATGAYNPTDIAAVGIAYQMHGLVLVDKDLQILRNAIIWCDSRAVETGNQAFEQIGKDKCLNNLLNSPGNFTASKLAWVKQNEPALYEKIFHVLLPGDFIAMKMTGDCTTTVSALSEGIFWDFQKHQLSEDIIHCFGFSQLLFPTIQPLFGLHGKITQTVADILNLRKGIPVAYKAGDQPNNALSLQVLHPGELAATAGTSGVIYGVNDRMVYDKDSRINSFAHVNHTNYNSRIGVLLCMNGTGIFNRWLKSIAGNGYSYMALNDMAAKVPAGAGGLYALPFGNGAERMLNNKIIGAHFTGLDFNLHNTAHLVRSVQEGIAFAMRYGLDIMRENGMQPSVVRAARANLFQSDVFTQAFASVNNVAVEFFNGDGSLGAALGAGIGAGFYRDEADAFSLRRPVVVTEPKFMQEYSDHYNDWKEQLMLHLN